MAKTQTRTVLVASATKAAAATTRGRMDCTGLDGGILTLSIANGPTAPTGQAVARVLIAHKDSAMPAAASEGSGDGDWKQVYEIGGGTATNAKTRLQYRFGPEVAYLEVEFPTHTGNDVTVEAIGTGYGY